MILLTFGMQMLVFAAIFVALMGIAVAPDQPKLGYPMLLLAGGLILYVLL